MAFKTLSTKKIAETKKPKDLDVGESIEGYLVRFEESKKYEGTTSLIMQGEDGEQFRVSPHGNIKWLIRDGALTVGLMTKITKTGNTTTKGMKSSTFDVAQDDEDFLDEAALSTPSSDASRSTSTAAVSRVNALAGKAAK